MSAVAKRELTLVADVGLCSTRFHEDARALGESSGVFSGGRARRRNSRSTLERRTTWNVTMERRLESEMRGSPCLDAARMKRVWPTTYSVKTGGTSG